MIDSILGIVNKFIPDKGKANALKAAIKTEYEKSLQKAIEADKDIKLAELKKGGIAAIWRPASALGIFASLFLYWFIYPLSQMIISATNANIYLPQLEPLPLEYYGMATAFISIYAYGRSAEKRK